MKKFALFFVILAILFSTPTVMTVAAENESIPYYVGIKETRNTISISSGMANCYSSVSTRDTSYRISYMMHLQKMDSSWKNVASWVVSGTYRASREVSEEVESGKYYRLLIVGNIYDANWNLIESFEEVSTTQRCP